jgi:hypothetical protein
VNPAFSENDIEAVIKHYADWEGFPRFDLLESDLAQQDLGFMSFPVQTILNRAVKLLGSRYAPMLRQVLYGEAPDDIVHLLDKGSGIIERAIARCPYEAEFAYDVIPIRRIRTPWEHVQGPVDAFVEALGYEPPEEDAELQYLAAALAIWSCYRARRLASQDAIDAESYVAEALEFLSIAERRDGVSVHRAAGANHARKERNSESDIRRDLAHEKIWLTRKPKEPQKVTVKRITAFDPEADDGQAKYWIRTWRVAEKRPKTEK